MVDDNAKRRKHNNIRLDDLSDELLVEILCRLPCCKTVVMCKSVCKHWAQTVSHPLFVNRFVAYKATRKITRVAIENEVSKYDEIRMKMTNDRTFGLVLHTFDLVAARQSDPEYSWKRLLIRFNDPINNPCDVSYSRLPMLANKGIPSRLHIVGACNDWLLYRIEKEYKTFSFHLYNVQNKQCFVLPSLRHPKIVGFNNGFVCDSNYASDTSHVSSNLTPNEAYRACVVVIPYTAEAVTEFPAYILSPPTTRNTWCNVILALPLRCILLLHGHVFWIGRNMYFICLGCFIGFDPFVDVKDGVIECHSIRTPPSLKPTISFITGVFHEQLHLCYRQDDGTYRVWILENYETQEWTLRHSMMVHDSMIPRDHWPAKIQCQDFGNPIGFHPVNPDVIYVLCQRWIVLLNLSTRETKRVCKLPKHTSSFSFQITLPVWPSPVPTFIRRSPRDQSM